MLPRFNKLTAVALSVVVISINIYFVGVYATTNFPDGWLKYFGLSIFGLFYLMFCTYLTVHVAISMGAPCLTSSSVSLADTWQSKNLN